MPRERFVLADEVSPIYALLVVADALRESPAEGSCGPWSDEMLADRVVEVEGPDDLIVLCGDRLIRAGLPFTVS